METGPADTLSSLPNLKKSAGTPQVEEQSSNLVSSIEDLSHRLATFGGDISARIFATNIEPQGQASVKV